MEDDVKQLDDEELEPYVAKVEGDIDEDEEDGGDGNDKP